MITKVEMQAMDAVIGIHREMKKANVVDWEQRRYEVAREAMSAILSNSGLVASVTAEGEPRWGTKASVASVAVKFADILISELKKERSE